MLGLTMVYVRTSAVCWFYLLPSSLHCLDKWAFSLFFLSFLVVSSLVYFSIRGHKKYVSRQEQKGRGRGNQIASSPLAQEER